MKRWLLLFAVVQCFTSCAYVQTHKNVEESFYLHEGARLSDKPVLYQAGGQYLLEAELCSLRKRYPVVRDTIFLNRDNEPVFHVEQQQGKVLYYPISDGTATVLQRADGYASLSILRDEMQRSAPIMALPRGARLCTVKAQFAEQDVPNAGVAINRRVPEVPVAGERFLTYADMVLVDGPGTLGYNCLIPVMAPFVFFHRFLNEE